MGPLLLIVVGVVALCVGALVLRTFGPRYRVGRLLAATPIVSVAEALTLAVGSPRYIGVRGRIDAVDEFEDAAHRPLVLRHARIELRRARGWELVDEHRQVVDFEIRDGLDTIAIDHAALLDGLVVVPRESVGVASDASDRVPTDTPPGMPMRLRVEQVSSVEHATALGVPREAGGGTGVILTAGLDRPLVLTTLENDEAMRILAASGPRRPLVAAIALVGGLVSLTLGLAWAILGTTATALAASPAPTVAGGDPRSSGQGPGLVGEPLVAIALVLAIGIVATVGTMAYVRVTERQARGRSRDRSDRHASREDTGAP